MIETAEEQTRRFAAAFEEGFETARAGLPASTALETGAGPVEGRETEDGMAYDLPDGRVFETWRGTDGSITCTLDGKFAAKLGPVEIEEEEPDADES